MSIRAWVTPLCWQVRAWRRLLIAAMAVAGCGDSSSLLPTISATAQDHTFVVRARGELVPSESIAIRMPSNIDMRFNITWMVPEYSEVRKGQVVVRFDDSEVLVQREISVLEVVDSDLQIDSHVRRSGIDRTRIGHEAERVEDETDIAETYVTIDPRLMSRNEYIDALGDLAYLGVEEAYYAWQAITHDQRSFAEQRRIESGRDASRDKLAKQDSALAQMELHSPADGTFVYARTPWGRKLSKGQSVFPGRAVGLLPIRGKVRARIYVPEVDAVGIEPGQPVALRIDSEVERDFAARISSVSPVAVPRDRSDPQKYFVVEAELDRVDPEVMRVGSSLTATITTGTVRAAFLLPQQAVFFEQDQAFIYVLEQGDPLPRQVDLGHRSPTLVEVTRGLVSGEQVAVSAPRSAS